MKAAEENKEELDALAILSQEGTTNEATTEENNSDKENSTPVKADQSTASADPTLRSELSSTSDAAAEIGSMSPSASSTAAGVKKTPPAVLDPIKLPARSEGSVREILAEIPVGLDVAEDDYDTSCGGSVSSSLLKGTIANNHKKKSAAAAASMASSTLSSSLQSADSPRKRRSALLTTPSLSERLTDGVDGGSTDTVPMDVDSAESFQPNSITSQDDITPPKSIETDSTFELVNKQGVTTPTNEGLEIESLFSRLSADDKAKTLGKLLRVSDYHMVVQSYSDFLLARK